MYPPPGAPIGPRNQIQTVEAARPENRSSSHPYPPVDGGLVVGQPYTVQQPEGGQVRLAHLGFWSCTLNCIICRNGTFEYDLIQHHVMIYTEQCRSVVWPCDHCIPYCQRTTNYREMNLRIQLRLYFEGFDEPGSCDLKWYPCADVSKNLAIEGLQHHEFQDVYMIIWSWSESRGATCHSLSCPESLVKECTSSRDKVH